MMCMALILVCSVSISTFAVDRMSQVESGTTQSVQKTDNQNNETATTRQKSSEVETKTKQENTKKSDFESKTKENKDSSEEKQSNSKDVNDKGAKENSTQKEEKEKKEKSEKDTSKEEKSTKEETDTDKKTTDTTDTSEATTKTAEEKKTESAEEKTTEAATEKTTESKDREEETSEKKAEEETQAADAKRQKIQVAEITGSKEVQVGKTITLTGTTGYGISNHKWTSSDTNTATIDGNNNRSTVTVRGITTGTVTIKHSYMSSSSWGSSETKEESYTVNVVKASDEIAAIYFLATPDGLPESNDTQYWAPKSDKSTLFGKINTTGATWEENKNIMNNVSSYVVSWPDGSTKSNWVINKGADKFDYILDSIWTTYKSTIAQQLGVTDLNKTDVTQITLTPFKISRNNSPTTNQYYHIDCTIDVKCKNVFTAKFWVKNPNSDYKPVDAKIYLEGKQVAKTDKAIIGFEKNFNGVTYVLDGWYPENADHEAYGSTKIADTGWPYTPSDTELKDGTVNFYAHYSPKTTSIILKKLVTGSMGDKQKRFQFTISVKQEDKNATFKVGNTSATGFATVNLANNEESILREIPVGANVTITESDYSESRYTTSYTVDDKETVKNNREAIIASIQANEDVSAHQVVFTNNKEAIPDTGIASDVLPFITLFALSIAGIIGFLLYSYKKRFV